MIMQRQKPFEDILKYLEGEGRVFVIGCTECATVCQVGGEPEVEEMKKKLEGAGKKVTGTAIPEAVCMLQNTKKVFREHKKEIDEADSILVLCCGDGVQTAKEASGKKVHPGTDSLFLGEVLRFGQFEERCRMCGDCILDRTGGICPITRCSKGLLNGPCGGYSAEGKCEVDPERDCAWLLIYKALEETGELDKIKEPAPPRDYSKNLNPQKLVLERKGERNK